MHVEGGSTVEQVGEVAALISGAGGGLGGIGLGRVLVIPSDRRRHLRKGRLDLPLWEGRCGARVPVLLPQGQTPTYADAIGTLSDFGAHDVRLLDPVTVARLDRPVMAIMGATDRDRCGRRKNRSSSALVLRPPTIRDDQV